MDQPRKRGISFHIAKSSGGSSDHAKYNRKRNHVMDMIRESKKTYFNNNLNGVNTKSFWKTVRMLNNNNASLFLRSLKEATLQKLAKPKQQS